MSEIIRLTGQMVLALVFVVCIWMSWRAADPKRRAALVCIGCLGGIGALWLTGIHGFLVTGKPIYFFSATLGTVVGAIGGIMAVARSRKTIITSSPKGE